MRRRRFLKIVLAGVLLITAGIRRRLAGAAPSEVFRHGVCSGDPLDTSVMLWTRISGVDSGGVDVAWQVAGDPDMRSIVANGTFRTDASRDFTVKVDAQNLPPGRQLFYRFDALGAQSPTGRTKTLPLGRTELAKLAVVSCSNYPAGFFHVYRQIAARSDLDAVLHLGDYIYEGGMPGYATEDAESLGRVPQPPTELRTLADYRQRYAQYRSDPDSQAMLASLPLIAVWDDHELANNAYRHGAEGHAPEDGRWRERYTAAIRAYFEWMPIRGEAKGGRTRIFREFRFGDLATLIMLDTRFYGRDPQPDAGAGGSAQSIAAALGDPRRRMLGSTQEKWLRRRLKEAKGTTWQVLGQQVLVASLRSVDLESLVDPDGASVVSKERLARIIERSGGEIPVVLDAWDGYPLAREDLYTDLREYAANAVILSGDLHTHLAANLLPDGDDRPVAVEFMTGAVSSPVMSDVLPEYEPNSVRTALLARNPSLKYLDTRHRGWLCLTLTKDACKAEWHLVDTVKRHDYRCWQDKTLTVRAGEIGRGLQA